MITFIEYNNVSQINTEVAISVDSAGVSTYTVPAGKKGVSFQNVGSKIAWYGGSTVDPANNKGNKLFPNQSLVFKNIKKTFTISWKCAAGESTSIGVNNYD